MRALYFFAGIALLAGSVEAFGNRTQLLSASDCEMVSGTLSDPNRREDAAGNDQVGVAGLALRNDRSTHPAYDDFESRGGI